MNHTIAEETIELTVTGLANANKVKAVAYRVDSVNSNAMPYVEALSASKSDLTCRQPVDRNGPAAVSAAEASGATQGGVATERSGTSRRTLRSAKVAHQTMPFSVVNSTTIVFNFTVEPQALINIILL